MARYLTAVATPLPPSDAFAYVADLRNFPAWDPGVRRAVQVQGLGPGADAAYDLTIASNGTVMRYEVRDFAAPERIVLESRTRLLRSLDEIRVAPDPDGPGSIVTYDALLTLNGPLGLLDGLLRPVLRKLGDEAAAGLRKALRGVAVPV